MFVLDFPSFYTLITVYCFSSSMLSGNMVVNHLFRSLTYSVVSSRWTMSGHCWNFFVRQSVYSFLIVVLLEARFPL